jgi:hypothetical protein
MKHNVDEFYLSVLTTMLLNCKNNSAINDYYCHFRAVQLVAVINSSMDPITHQSHLLAML